MNATAKRTSEIATYGSYGNATHYPYELVTITAGGRKDNLGKVVEIKIMHGCAIVSRLGKKDKFYSTPTAARIFESVH